jgi:hypothetical protein
MRSSMLSADPSLPDRFRVCAAASHTSEAMEAGSITSLSGIAERIRQSETKNSPTKERGGAFKPFGDASCDVRAHL